MDNIMMSMAMAMMRKLPGTASAQAAAVLAEAETVAASIPEDYTALSGDVSALKSALGEYVNIDIASWVDGVYYNTPNSVSSITPDNLTTDPTGTFCCGYLECVPGDTFILTGIGGGGGKLWVWTKSDGTIISRAASNATAENMTLTAPADAAYLLSSVDKNNAHSLKKGETVDERIEKSKELSAIRMVDTVGNVEVVGGDIRTDILSKLRKIPGVNMNNPTFLSSTVFDYLTKATALATGNLYEAIRVRDVYGNQIVPFHLEYDPVPYMSARMAFGYKADGSPDVAYNAENVTDGVLALESTTYYLVFQSYTTLDLKVWASIGTAKTDYYVGEGMEYTTFHDCLVALKGNETEKTIHVYGKTGGYDILAEMGGQTFLNGLSSSDLWYEVCDIIPPNTHVIGHGNVIFDLTIPSGTSADIAVHLSPINMIGSSTIENLTINCNGGRYCVHADGSHLTENNNAVWRLINCKMNKTNNLSGVQNVIGVGINDGGLLEVRDCVLVNDGSAGLLVHDQQTVAGSYSVSPRIIVTNCAIDAQYYPCVWSSTHSGAVSGAVLEAMVINCFANNKFMRKIGSGNKDVFKVTYINTPHRTQNQDGIVDLIADTDYNNFALS